MSCHSATIYISIFPFTALQLMEFIITAPLTAIRVPDDYSEENSLSLITSILRLTSKGERLGRKRFPGIYRQRARQNAFKQANKPKSLKWWAFQRGSNLVQANPAGRLKEVHFVWGIEPRQDINPAEKVLGKLWAKDKSPSPETCKIGELLWCVYR